MENPPQKTQVQIVYEFLLSRVTTASIVAEETGIKQKSVTRYKRSLEKNGMLWEIRRVRCPLTGFWAMEITTNPDKRPKSTVQQLPLPLNYA